MSDWKEKLKQAKELLDLGVIDQAEFEQIKKKALREMGLVDETPQDTFMGDTQYSSNTSDTFSGQTRLENTSQSANQDFIGLTLMGQNIPITEDSIEGIQIGALFHNRYSIVSQLGTGGLGVVYQAVDTKLNQTVALKIIRPSLAGNEKLISSLSQEAALSQKFNHPNLLNIRHFESNFRVPYLVMELVDDGDLEELLASKGGMLEKAETLRIIRGIVEGLKILHQEKILHLDLKPQNILLGKNGAVKLGDFGISSRIREQRGGHSRAGTILYAPPEQMDGKDCDVRADIYALGMMVCQLLSGRFPFPRDSKQEIENWHRNGSRAFDFLETPIARVLSKSCAIKREERHQSVEEFFSALEASFAHKTWFLELPPKDWVHPTRLWVDEAEVELDVLAFYDQLILSPSLDMREGKIVLEGSPFALAEVGEHSFVPEEFQDVIFDMLQGNSRELAQLSEQEVLWETDLAMLAYRRGISGAEKRLYYAEENAEVTYDWLLIAQVYLVGAQDQNKAEMYLDLAKQKAKDAYDYCIIGWYYRWVLGDIFLAQRMVYQAEKIATENYLTTLVGAYVGVLLDWDSADKIIQKIVDDIVDETNDLEKLTEKIGKWGLRPPLREKLISLENELKQDTQKITEAEAERSFGETVELSERYLSLISVWKQTGIPMEEIQEKIVALALQAIKAMQGELSLIRIELALPNSLTEESLKMFVNQAKAQLAFHQRLFGDAHSYRGGVVGKAKLFNLEIPNWSRPYQESQIQELELKIKEQERFKEACNSQFNLPMPAFPLSKEKVDGFQKHEREQEEFQKEIDALHRQLSLEKPEPPYSREIIDTYKKQIEQEGKKRQDRAKLISLIAFLIAMFVGWKWYQASSLQNRADEIGWDVQVKMFDHEEIKQEIEQWEELYSHAKNLEMRAEAIGWKLDAGDPPYEVEKLEETEEDIRLSEELHPRVLELQNRAKDMGFEIKLVEMENPKKDFYSNRSIYGFPYIKENVDKSYAFVEEMEVVYKKAVTLKNEYGLDFLKDNKIVSVDTRINQVYEWQQNGLNLSVFDFSSIDPEDWVDLRRQIKEVKIPAGSFDMGCDYAKNEHCDLDQGPVHRVKITRSFYMMKTEVTQRLYKHVTGTNPTEYFEETEKKSDFINPRYPVTDVKWQDALRFANKLSRMDGLETCYEIRNGSSARYIKVKWAKKLDCKGWRLPTEAEWEYAARANQNYLYAGSNDVKEAGWTNYSNTSGGLLGLKGNPPKGLHYTCGKKENGFGLCDMTGNIQEWVWDKYDSDYYQNSPSKDPLGPVDEESIEVQKRVTRGCGWVDYDFNCLISDRDTYDASYNEGGVRLVRTIK